MKSFRSTGILLVLGLAVGLLALWPKTTRKEAKQPPPISSSALSKPGSATQARLSENYGKLPLSFEANQGQTDSQVKFLSRGSGYQLYLTATEAVLQLQKAEPETRKERREGEKGRNGEMENQAANRKMQSSLVKMKLVGANLASAVVGREALPGKSNYFIGNDPSKWSTDVPNYAKVEYEQVWPGVNLVYYGNQRQLEYDFVVAPGADPRAIKLAFDGAEQVEINAQGELVLRIVGSEVVMRRPLVYQEVNGTRQEVAGGYVLEGNQARFRLGEYDESKPLVIDPVLAYSTFLGGNSFDEGYGIAVDSAGNAYVTGATFSTDFPTVNPVQATYAQELDAFVVKLNPTGSALLYSTYLGGSGADSGTSIAVDSAGNAYVTGGPTNSANFPTVNPLQATRSGVVDAFVSKLNPTGSALLYSTYLGGSGADSGNSIAVDSAGNAYVAGFTSSTNFPTANPVQPAFGGNIDAFVAKLNPAGSALVYSTYLGGSDIDKGNDIAVDSVGNAYVIGETRSTNFPTANPLQANFGGSYDAFVVKLNPTGSALVYSTNLGGNESDFGYGIAVDSAGNAYVTGDTSGNFPTVNPFQATLRGLGDAFVAKLNPAGSALVYSTYLGGSIGEVGRDIAVDSAGNAYVVGQTSSTDFPTANPLQPTSRGGNGDVFVTKLNSAGSALIYSTYLGGNSLDIGWDIAVDTAGNAYITGETSSTNFPTMTPLKPSLFDGIDAFIAKICDAQCAGPTGPAPACKPNLPGTGNLPASSSVESSASDQARLSKLYRQLPLSFEANQGQTDSQVKFLSHGYGYGMFLTPTEAVLALRQPQEDRATTLRMKLLAANPAPQVVGRDKLPGQSNYFTGSDPQRWHTQIANYAKVEYQDVYPGVNLVYYGNQQQLEYDLIVAPGADPKKIKLAFEGAEKIEIDDQGDLVLHTPGGELRQHKPVIYQEIAGVRKTIAGRYLRRGKNQIGFQVKSYDRRYPLVIDPVLSYATYLGGTGRDEGFGIAVDAAGNTYVTGRTLSATSFPISNAFQSVPQGGFDVFVTKLDPTQAGGASLVYSTFLSGDNNDEGFGIAVDGSGNAYVTGRTFSGSLANGFPVTKNTAFQSELKGGSDAFVTKLNAAGNVLLYSTFLGDRNNDDGFGIAVDLFGNAYVTGRTVTPAPPESGDFPIKNAFQPRSFGLLEAFVARLDPTKVKEESLVYSTYLGGDKEDEAFGIAVDFSGNAYVTGRTLSLGPIAGFPVKNAIQRVGQSGFDAFVSKISPTGNTLLYSTFLSGTDTDEGYSIAVDAESNAYVTGRTDSSNFLVRNAFLSARQGQFDVFVTKLRTSLPTCTEGDIGSTHIFCNESLVYSTFLGGGGDDVGCGIALDELNNAHVTGSTASVNFPSHNAIQLARGGDLDAFVTKLVAGGNALHYSSFFGGIGLDEGFGIAVGIEHSAFITGRTLSQNLPINSAFQATNHGQFDAFVAKLTSGLQIPKILNFGGVGLGDTKDLPLVIRNIDSRWIIVNSLTSSAEREFSVITPLGTNFAIDAGQQLTVTLRFTPLALGVRTAALRVTSDDPGRPVFDVQLLGGGVDPQAPKIEVTPNSLDFGNVTLGQPKDLTLTVRNKGAVSALIMSAFGFDNPRFSVVSPATPVSVAAGATATVTLRFTPTTLFAEEGFLTIASNDTTEPSFNVRLRGLGVSPVFEVEPLSLDFGNVVVGQTRDLQFNLRNRGNVPLVVSAITSSNPQFSATAPTTPISAGGGDVVTVRFVPTSASPQTGTLTIASNDPARPSVTISLAGTGTTPGNTNTVVLTVDDGTFENSLGYPNGATNANFVNRLTPTSYPSTLQEIQIYFGNRANGLGAGTPITLLAAANPSGNSNIDGIAFQTFPATVGTPNSFAEALNGFTVYTLPTPLTITSGDFVVGFRVNNPPNTFPADRDTTPPSKVRSYASSNGSDFETIDSFGADLAGNFGIRARVGAPTSSEQKGALYVLKDCNGCANQIYGYSVDETTGALTLLPGFPISTGGNGTEGASEQLTIDRVNRRLYVVNEGSDTVSAYAINPATGALTALPFSPINLGSGLWTTIAVHPSGSPLVVGDAGGSSGRLASFQITATTATAASGSPFNTGTALPFSTAFSQNGNYLYTGGQNNTTIAGLSVNAATGVLTALAGSPFNSGANFPSAYATDAAGRLFVGNDYELRVFTTVNGIPSGVSGNPFASGVATIFHGLLHPNGFYLVADPFAELVGVYRIQGSGSATTLTSIADSPFVTGGAGTNVLALNQAGTFLFAANSLSRSLTTFSVNPTTGVLNGLSTQPDNTHGAAGGLAGLAYFPLTSSSVSCPTITGLSPGSGAVGSSVTITGSGLNGINAIKFANNVSAIFTVNNDTAISVTVPAGAVNGPITISKTGCSDAQTASFTVTPTLTCPTMTNINPTSGAVGSNVTITGTNFTGVTSVKFANNVAATFTMVNETTITAVVPAGAVSGSITLSKPNCSDVQTASFTVTTTGGSCSVKADYQFQTALSSSTGSPPALTNLGNNTFGPATVDGASRTVLRFAKQDGLVLSPTTGVISSGVYSVVVLFAFNEISGYRRMLDFKNNVQDTGLYNRDGKLVFFGAVDGTGTPITANTFIQVVLTRDATKNVTGYVNGVQQFTFVDSSDLALIDANNKLIFFRDNANQEASAGSVARIRLYDCALTASAVAALDRLPSQTPTNCPTVSSINPTSGAVGSSVTITGTNLIGVTSVKFANNVTATFTLNSDTQITATAPAGAVNGPITISKAGCSDTQSASFTVTTASTCVSVSIANNLTGSTGSSLTVPVIVSDLTGKGVTAYDFVVSFNPAVVQPLAPDAAGTLSSGLNITPNSTVAGKLTVSAFGTTALSGAGTLLNLKFNLIGAAGTSSALTLSNFVFNEGTPCATVSHGQISIAGGVISGTVTYGTSATSKAVPGVVVTATGTPSATSNTSSTGSYSLTGLGSGAYMVTATKTGDLNGISSLDAANVAQQVAGLINLTDNQKIAADASGNGTLSSFDASLIAQTAAGLPNSGIAGTWKFMPANRSYPSLSGEQTNQNFAAILVGDVTGNWSASTSSALTAQAQAQVQINDAAQVTVSLPHLSAVSSSSVTIPLMVGNLTGLGIFAYDFVLTFDPNVLQLQTTPIDIAGTLSSGMTITPNVTSPGRLVISAFGSTPLTGAGRLLNLKFKVIGALGTSTPLAWQAFTFNEGTPSVETVNGNVVDVQAAPANYVVGAKTNAMRTATIVSAANYEGTELASEAIAAAFGTGLATITQAAETLSLPTTLGGTQVLIRDSQGVERLAPLFFVSPAQINYQIPPETASGVATVMITSGDGVISIGTIQITSVAPSLFTFTADGQGVVAAVARRFRDNQELPSETIVQLDAQNRWRARAIDLGSDSDLVILEMFGTGLRFHQDASAVAVKIGGAQAQLFYAGPAPGLAGVDQIDVAIPRSLIGRGKVEIVLTVDGKAANTVEVNIK